MEGRTGIRYYFQGRSAAEITKRRVYTSMTLPWNRENIEDIWVWPHIYFLNLPGWWAEEANSTFLRKFLLKYRIFTMAYVLLLILSMFMGIVKGFTERDLIDNLFTIFAASPGIIGVYKMIEVVKHRRTLKSLMEDLIDMFSEVNDPVIYRLVQKKLRKVWVIFFVALVWGAIITTHWMTRPFLVAMLYQEKSTIVNSWPIYLDTWEHFYYSYGYQIFGIMWLGHSYFLYDNVYICMAELILCHFTILQHRLNHLILSKDLKGSTELLACIKYHSKILRVCKTLSIATSKAIFGQFIITVIMLCSGVFLLTSSIGINGNQDMNILEVTMNASVILYFYCWYSNEMTFQCMIVRKAIYMSHWINGTVSDKKSLHIMMTRTARPVYFGGMLRIDLSTFINVLKTTFSYYNFLNAVNETKHHP